MKEKLSAFIDNELSELEERKMLAELERNEELRSTWERYHLIRAAMRNELKGTARTNISRNVASAVSHTASQAGRRALAVTIGKAVGGLAIAASVATVAILSLQSPSTGPVASGNVATATSPVGGKLVPVVDGLAPAGLRNSPAPVDDTLNTYLLEHNEFAPTAGMSNILPYVRTVNDDNGR